MVMVYSTGLFKEHLTVLSLLVRCRKKCAETYVSQSARVNKENYLLLHQTVPLTLIILTIVLIQVVVQTQTTIKTQTTQMMDKIQMMDRTLMILSYLQAVQRSGAITSLGMQNAFGHQKHIVI